MFHSGDPVLSLGEYINDDVLYTDGTTKSWSEIDWSTVKIKYCKIEKIITYQDWDDNNNNVEIDINYEKEFN